MYRHFRSAITVTLIVTYILQIFKSIKTWVLKNKNFRRKSEKCRDIEWNANKVGILIIEDRWIGHWIFYAPSIKLKTMGDFNQKSFSEITFSHFYFHREQPDSSVYFDMLSLKI